MKQNGPVPFFPERGFTLLETMASLGAASFVALALCAMLGSSGLAFRGSMSAISDLSVSAQAEAAVRAGVRALGRSRQQFAMTVSPGAPLVLPNGAAHPLAALSGKSSPAPDSHVISFLELSPHYAGAIEQASIEGFSVTVVACGFSSRPAPSQFKSYVALGVSGPVQLAGSLRTVSSSCVELVADALPGLVSDPAVILPSSLHRLVPVNREYSLFVDRTEQLRISSHTAARITENQPLASGVRALLFDEILSAAGAVALSTTVQGSHGQVSTFLAPFPVARGSLYYGHIL